MRRGGGFHRARGHQRVVAVGELDSLEAEPHAKRDVVERYPPAREPQLRKRCAYHRPHVEGVVAARAFQPVDAGAALRYEALDVGALRRQVERHHHRAERPDVGDPGRLREEGREVVVGDNKDWVLWRPTREQHRVGARLVGLVRDRVEAGEVEDVLRRGGDDALEAARFHGVQQAIEVAETLHRRQRRAGPVGSDASISRDMRVMARWNRGVSCSEWW